VKSYLKRILIPAALVLVGVTAALAPAARVTTHPVNAITAATDHTDDDTPWG
jgi:hypothetical protein